MIKRINHIKNFGVFGNYKRTGDIQDFAKVNIIYGWNYSGKTTISRIFQTFELKKKNEHYPVAEFELEDYENNKGNQDNQNINNYSIKVFNSDFVRDNIHLEGENFDPVLLLGDDAKKAEVEIKLKNKKLDKIKGIVKNLNSEYKRNENLILDGLSNRAASIKENLQIVQAFTRSHIKPIFDSLKSNYKSALVSESKVQDLLKSATASEEDKLPALSNHSVNILISEKILEAKSLLSVIPEFSNTIRYFVDNPEIANWVEKGLPLHEEKSRCEFCGETLSEKRIAELTAHFSEDLKNHKRLLDALVVSIGNCKLKNPINSKSDFYKELWASFEANDMRLKQAIISYNKQLDNLIALVNEKRDNSFQKITDFTSVSDEIEIISSSIVKYNEMISQNTTKTLEFDKTKTDAIKTLKNHYTAKFIDEINLFDKERKIELYKSREVLFLQLQVDIEKQIAQLEAKISQAHKGKETLNEFIQKFLGREEIKVVVVKEGEKERFKLNRKDTKAVNLSEGEKTAIAFSFFLTKLIECKDLSKTIVYIDDPISSLDSNHVFQVNALLKDFFFSKEKPNDDNSSTVLKCLQLFLSTHNFDFFGLLRELPTPKESNKFFYQIKRINENEAIIDKLPKSIENYSSEYHYLFDLIYSFQKSENKDYRDLMGIPNAVRRFVELYTYSRMPGNHNNSVDKRAEKLWGAEKAKRILKVFHYFSHSANIERMIKNSDLMCDIENAVTDLIELIKIDDIHYKELEKGVAIK
jgi:wobble nucleotide-excising tRNase